jgi:hypothetical protein
MLGLHPIQDTELRCLMEQEADIEKRRKFTREFKLEASTFGWCYPIATIVSFRRYCATTQCIHGPSVTMVILAFNWGDNR